MVSARVGSPMTSCQVSTSSCLGTMVAARPWRSSRISSRSRRSCAARLARPQSGAISVSAVTIGEIARGDALEARRNPNAGAVLGDWLDPTCLQFADRILPFDATAGRVWGRLCAEIAYDGADLQIAATALVVGFSVASRNTRHYAPTGVGLVDQFDSLRQKTSFGKSIGFPLIWAMLRVFARYRLNVTVRS